MIIDFHTHLDWYTNQEELFSELKNFSGVIVAASVDLESYKKNIQIQKKASRKDLLIIPTFGVHPEFAEKYEQNLQFLDNALNQSKMIGEIGMDFYWATNVSKSAQEKVFRYILEHCHNHKKFCLIHTKGAEKEILEILNEYPKAKPIIHWYNGPKDIYLKFLERGYYQTFGCQTIRNEYLQELLKLTPPNLILAETDNPTAEPWLGGTDSSVNLIHRIYEDLAQILNTEKNELEKIIWKNASIILQDEK